MKIGRFVIGALLAAALSVPTAMNVHSASTVYGGPLPPDPATGLHRNSDGEPGIAVDGSGTFWVGSNVMFGNDPRNGEVFTGEDVWKSTNDGRSYQWVASPFGVTNTTPGLGGEDSDIAVAPAPNGDGYYNVYAVSLWIGSTSVAISQDGGKTWIIDPLGGIPAEDRPWAAADGPCTLYVAYHQLPTWDPVINKYDLCNVADQAVGAAVSPTSSTSVFMSNSIPGLTNDFGKIAVDTWPTSPFRHTIYVPMMGCDLNGPEQVVQNEESSSGCLNKTELFIGVSTDGGRTFNDYKVAEGANGEEPIWCCSVGTDHAGTVYFAWTDNHNVYVATSENGGQTWYWPRRVNSGGTAVYPTVAGGTRGQVKVAYYWTSRTGDTNDPARMGNPNAKGAAAWTVAVAQSTNFGGSYSSVGSVTPVVHTGVLCTEGDGCSITNSRNLYDDFGAALSPTTGTLSIAYTSDQPSGQNADVFTGYATIPR